jgi:uncharacterized protein YecE (DUF72 family)
MEVRIGTSGWIYQHWRGIFYPPKLPQRAWFEYYAGSFDTVEINNSFYRLPSAETFQEWRKQAPRGFVYAVKASRYLTHMKKLSAPEEPLKTFFERARKLGKTLGPVLYQLPPYWHVNLERFEHFCKALPKKYTHVVEFRDASWLIEDVFRVMEKYNVALCIHDMAPLKVPERVTADTVYVRFHGVERYSGSYPKRELEMCARRIEDWQKQKLDVYVYFNNDIGGYAVENARTLKELAGV